MWRRRDRAEKRGEMSHARAAVTLPTAAVILHFFGQGEGIFGQCDWVRTSIAGLMGVLAIWRHKPNIERLMAGTEKRFEGKSKKKTNV